MNRYGWKMTNNSSLTPTDHKNSCQLVKVPEFTFNRYWNDTKVFISRLQRTLFNRLQRSVTLILPETLRNSITIFQLSCSISTTNYPSRNSQPANRPIKIEYALIGPLATWNSVNYNVYFKTTWPLSWRFLFYLPRFIWLVSRFSRDLWQLVIHQKFPLIKITNPTYGDWSSLQQFDTIVCVDNMSHFFGVECLEILWQFRIFVMQSFALIQWSKHIVDYLNDGTININLSINSTGFFLSLSLSLAI